MQSLQPPFRFVAGLTFCFIIVVLNNTTLSAQSKRKLKNTQKVLATKSEIIELATASRSRFDQKLPLKHIVVHDNRIDTSYLCLFRRSLGTFSAKRLDSRKIKSLNGLSHDFSSFLHQYVSAQLTDTSAATIHCFVKQFRLFDAGTIQDSSSQQARLFLQVKLEMECYYGSKNKFHPAIRIDSMLILSFKSKRGINVVNTAIDSIAALFSAKLNSMNLEKIFKRKAYDYDSLQNRYAYPEKAVSQLQVQAPLKGIYWSFEEWKNNKPGYTDNFSVQLFPDDQSDGIYDAKDHLIYPDKVFGVSDGKDFWIRSFSKLYPLTRVGNSYEFYGMAPIQAEVSFYDAMKGANGLYITQPGTAGLASGAAASLIFSGLLSLLPASHYNCTHVLDLHTGMIY